MARGFAFQVPVETGYAQIEQLKMQLDEATKLADKNITDLKKAGMQESAETERAMAKLQADEEKTRADNETRLAVAELGAKVDRLALFFEERQRLGVQSHEHNILTREQQHEREMAAQQHAQALQQGQQQTEGALIQGEQGQQHALEQGEQGHAQALDQAAQQAALQPEPTE